MPDRPEAPLVERTELVDFDGANEVPREPEVLDASEVLEDRLDRCAPAIPLVEETASVLTEVDALFEDDRPNDRPDVALGLLPLCEEEFCK
jgi:hypothetical protein